MKIEVREDRIRVIYAGVVYNPSALWFAILTRRPGPGDPMRFPRGRLWVLTALSALVLATRASAQNRDYAYKATLADSDLSVAGISYGMDSNEVRRVLGPPISRDTPTTSRDIPPVSRRYSTTWHYDGLRIQFGDRPTVSTIEVVGRRYQTPRGLGVRDRVTRVTDLYGVPCQRGRGLYRYCRAVHDQRGIAIRVDGDSVTAIMVGMVINLWHL
jgi:hypothetical protein